MRRIGLAALLAVGVAFVSMTGGGHAAAAPRTTPDVEEVQPSSGSVSDWLRQTESCLSERQSCMYSLLSGL